ncbi:MULTISPECIES: indolepyruvate ferredoxin oxidoreductase subunit alpha [Paracoccaceae]|jgi:ferredoxin|uniref:indolepyruvate ferredoxin oxidoreductase subunit alpha n=1 Tax=Rhodobacterales TaxID=204455 RepID=UPI001B265116|nr:ferredoxin family protein [Boseongicola sp. H5]MBO6603887.1 ferredoxin family protein [Roseicyclus sp.]MBO6626198.1 ferredoxin family protein [Roseicyclus sp.]MBO6922327.1 ferredoxin family protein [Roseicyclus sp.]
MALVILSACVDVKDGICTTSCPVDCIYEGERMFYIHPTECIECGMCESICPVDAIRYDDEVPEGEEAYAEMNTAVFLDADGRVTEPGGWHKGMEPVRDAPNLATLTAAREIREEAG